MHFHYIITSVICTILVIRTLFKMKKYIARWSIGMDPEGIILANTYVICHMQRTHQCDSIAQKLEVNAFCIE